MSHQPQSSGPPNNSVNRADQLVLPPEPAPRPSSASVRRNIRDVLFAGLGQPPQPYLGAVDTGYPANLTLGGIGGQAQVTGMERETLWMLLMDGNGNMCLHMNLF